MFLKIDACVLYDTEFKTDITWDYASAPYYGETYFFTLYDAVHKEYLNRNLPISNLILVALWYKGYTSCESMVYLGHWFKKNNLEKYAVLL